jgi:hypothetical protein
VKKLSEEKMAKKKEPDKVRFVFGKDMTEAEMVDAVIRMAKEYGIPFKDNRREHGIPVVDSRKKDRAKNQKKKMKKAKCLLDNSDSIAD